jgi:gamma-glutamylaminecyclotransferase
MSEIDDGCYTDDPRLGRPMTQFEITARDGETEMVFVYGTLKRRYGNCRRCLSESEFIGEAVSFDARYKMVGGDGVPRLLEGGNDKVKGELFEVVPSDFLRCDSLEGHPHGYRREKRLFVLNDGRTRLAWVYLWPHPVGGQRFNKPVHGVLEWRAGDAGR